MIIVERIDDIPPLSKPCALTIGSFDGVHLGHQKIIRRLKDHGTAAILTFRNHPAEVLKHRSPPPLIVPLEERLRLLEKCGVDLVILLEFTPELAQQTYDKFLSRIHQYYPFEFLVLGHGARFGYQCQGDETHVKALGQKLGFTAEYVDKLVIGGEVVSSGKIREYIADGKLEQAAMLLGKDMLP